MVLGFHVVPPLVIRGGLIIHPVLFILLLVRPHVEVVSPQFDLGVNPHPWVMALDL